ncbi:MULTISPECIES: hypothetical protein [unclassified Lactococcus]|uniref:hypothetical protein n=1 Tax=unclassified Lactococcus TaxID=2643510 RepID=UPI00164F46BB|nr:MULTISPECIES: hypothetical protein [unclassified Lactococcus]
MTVITPAPKPSNEFFKIIAQEQARLNREDNKTFVDTNKEFKQLKEKKNKASEQTK